LLGCFSLTLAPDFSFGPALAGCTTLLLNTSDPLALHTFRFIRFRVFSSLQVSPPVFVPLWGNPGRCPAYLSRVRRLSWVFLLQKGDMRNSCEGGKVLNRQRTQGRFQYRGLPFVFSSNYQSLAPGETPSTSPPNLPTQTVESPPTHSVLVIRRPGSGVVPRVSDTRR